MLIGLNHYLLGQLLRFCVIWLCLALEEYLAPGLLIILRIGVRSLPSVQTINGHIAVDIVGVERKLPSIVCSLASWELERWKLAAVTIDTLNPTSKNIRHLCNLYEPVFYFGRELFHSAKMT